MPYEKLTRDGETRTPQTPDEDVKLRFDGWRPQPTEPPADSNDAAKSAKK